MNVAFSSWQLLKSQAETESARLAYQKEKVMKKVVSLKKEFQVGAIIKNLAAFVVALVFVLTLGVATGSAFDGRDFGAVRVDGDVSTLASGGPDDYGEDLATDSTEKVKDEDIALKATPPSHGAWELVGNHPPACAAEGAANLGRQDTCRLNLW